MYSIIFDVDYSALKDLVRHIETRMQTASALREAIQVAGDFATQQWLNTAATRFKHSQGGYARGIVAGIKYPFQGDPLHYRIEHTARYALALEEGFDSFDMKKMLQTSDKVRISKDGKRYLIIPFRHGIPGTKGLREMPKEIYKEAKGLRHSAATNTFREGSIRQAITMRDADLLRSSNPDKVIRNVYAWGDRLKDVDWPLEKKSHKTNIYEGMVRFQANPNVNRAKFNTGKFVFNEHNSSDFRGDYSIYMTFRIMHEDSSGWIHPGLKGMYILKETVERIRQPVLKMLGEAAKTDLQKILPKSN